jgi:uroporphyrin-III C-methyltransferase
MKLSLKASKLGTDKAGGKVYLVGGGPGDPDLLTVKAARLLERADVVLHDGLISQPILDMISPNATVIDIGKRCGNKLLTQAQINLLLIGYAETNQTVVRLKGGDPGIFGRAGEEIEALLEAGVPFEIVPGITAALAGAAAAGITLTDRRAASSVTFITAHRASGADSVEWDRMVSSRSTLVIYMPGERYADLSRQLCAAGLDSATPCAVVSSAWRPNQQIIWAHLGSLHRYGALPSPALVIVGTCAGMLRPEQFRADHDSPPPDVSRFYDLPL